MTTLYNESGNASEQKITDQPASAKTLRIFNCEGLALEMGDSLRKINDNVAEFPFEYDIAHIVTERGKILCTVLNPKALYESQQNADRRKHNVDNGYEVFWDEAGSECTIYHRVKTRKGAFKWTTAILGAAIGAIIGFCICLAIFGTSGKDSDEEILMTVWDDSVDSQFLKFWSEIRSINCTPETIEEFQEWYNDLPSDEQTYVDNTYLKAYDIIHGFNSFFNATDINDLVTLGNTYGGVFSPEQVTIILYGYGQSESIFDMWRSDFGMSFSAPYEQGLMRNAQERTSYVWDTLTDDNVVATEEVAVEAVDSVAVVDDYYY